jgi:hypothetical protein
MGIKPICPRNTEVVDPDLSVKPSASILRATAEGEAGPVIVSRSGPQEDSFIGLRHQLPRRLALVMPCRFPRSVRWRKRLEVSASSNNQNTSAPQPPAESKRHAS